MNGDAPIFVGWIDDEFAEVGNARNKLPELLMQETDNRLQIQTVLPQQIEDWLEDLRNDHVARPEILLIDLRLKSSQDGQKNTPPVFDNGRKLGSWLQFTEVASTPKYLVSHVFNQSHVGMQPEAFDWVLDQTSLIAAGQQLLSDGQDYRKVSNHIGELMASGKSHSEIVGDIGQKLSDELKTPPTERDNIAVLLIDEFELALREYSDDFNLDSEIIANKSATVSLNMSRWIRGTFLKRNGSLINDLMAATILGVRGNYFNTAVTPIIEEDNHGSEFFPYSGLFYVGETRRWWRQELIAWGLGKFEGVSINATSRMAEQFATCLAVPEEDKSVCAVCGENWPDTLARDAEHWEEIRQVHRGCSRTIKGQAALPGFDELREFNSK